MARARRLLGPGKIIGVSARSPAEAVAACAAGADYLGLGAVFATATYARPPTRLRPLPSPFRIPVSPPPPWDAAPG